MEEIDEKTGEMKTYDEFAIPDEGYIEHRLMVYTKGRLDCQKVGNEISCNERLPTGFLPHVCYIDEDGNEYCDYEFIRKYPDEYISMMMDLAQLEKVKPDLLNWLRDNAVKVVVDERCKREHVYGHANCRKEHNRMVAYSFHSPDPVKTLAHEIAHCKEDIARMKKGLPEPEGKWLVTEEDILPVGHEARAVHFAERFKKRRWRYANE